MWYVSLDRRTMSIPFLILFSTSLAGLLTRSSWFDMLMTSGSSFNPDDISALSFFLPSSPACKTWKISLFILILPIIKKSSSKSLAFPYTQNPASSLVTPIYDPVRIKLTRCKKRVNFYAWVTKIGSEHKGKKTLMNFDALFAPCYFSFVSCQLFEWPEYTPKTSTVSPGDD